jgi:hypothetical protein
MTLQYFKYQDSYWQIFRTKDPLGRPTNYAIELDSTHGSNDWERIEDTDIFIDKWFLSSDPNELFDHEYDEQYETEHNDSNHPTVDSSKLKKMLEGLKRSDDEIKHNLPVAILNMIRDREATVTKSLTKEEQQVLNLSKEEYTQLNNDAEYMALITRLRV